MKLSDYLQKPQFGRRIHNPSCQPGIGAPKKSTMRVPSFYSTTFDQEKFIEELNSGSHVIYDCNYRSMRPKYKWDEKEQKNVLDGYEDVTRNAVSWQQAIRMNKTAICGGNLPWIGNESGEEAAEMVAKVKAHINTLNLKAALLSLFHSVFGTADGALYFYKIGDKIQWQCFSYENGDNCTISKDYENPDIEMGVRLFDMGQRNAVELYRNNTIELWVQFADNDEYLENYPEIPIKKTEDNFYLVKSVNHGLAESPFCYFRENDIPSGPVQNNIEDWERLLSDCGENVKYYAYQILFLSGGAISLPNANFGGKVIGSKTPEGDAKILAPADASNTLEIAFKKTYDAIRDGSNSVFIKPEDLKGQNDSGAYIENLFWPETEFAEAFYARFHPCMVKILQVICQLVGLIEGDITSYKNLMLSYMLTPKLPKNKLEETQILQYSVESGFMSKETAAEESDYTNPSEMYRLENQKQKELELEAKKASMQNRNVE